VSAFLGIYILSRLSPEGTGDHLSVAVHKLGSESFTLSLCLNIVVTALIAGRIYYMIRRRVSALPQSQIRQYMGIVGIVVESGAIFCAGQIVFVTLWSLQSGAVTVVAHPMAQIYVRLQRKKVKDATDDMC
jgi:hypothetical protein